MPKGGSGFMKSASRQAGLAGKGGGGDTKWRFANPKQFDKEIQDLFKSIYRSDVLYKRDSRGKVIDFRGSDEAIDKASGRIYALASKMAQDIQEFQPEAQTVYSKMLQEYGKPIYVRSKDWREFLRTKKAEDSVLLNPRGKRGVSNAADTAARESNEDSSTIVNILNRRNEALNAQRRLIWPSASKTGNLEGYTNQMYDLLWQRYSNVEREAWRRRRNK